MKKIFILTFLGIAFLCFAFVKIGFIPLDHIENSLVYSKYELNTKLATKISNANIYMLKNNLINFEDFKKLSKSFVDKPNFYEDEIYFNAEEKTKKLIYNKNYSRLEFDDLSSVNKIPIQATDAIKIGEDCFNKFKLNLKYTKTELNFVNGKYDIKYINSVDDIPNYGFKNEVVIDEYGNVEKLIYFDINLKKIDTREIISEKDAFNKLNTNVNNEQKISISSCELIYIYQNSILVPTYDFKCKYNSEKEYDTFVPACSPF